MSIEAEKIRAERRRRERADGQRNAPQEEVRPVGFEVVSELAKKCGYAIVCHRHRASGSVSIPRGLQIDFPRRQAGIQVNFLRGRWLVASWWSSTGSLLIGPRKLLAQSLKEAWREVEWWTAATNAEKNEP